MKVLHCADLHLDSRMTTLLGSEKAKARRAELLNNFTRLVDYAKRNDIGSVLIAGDMFDSNTVSATARKAVKAAIESAPEINFFYLKGNHDNDNFLSGMEDVPANLFGFTDKWKTYLIGNTVSLTGAELTRENSAVLYNSLVLNADRFNIVTLHGQETESRPGDKTVAVSLPMLKNKGIDYLALGHIHEFKKAELDKRGIYSYPGCLEGRGYDETGEHGFVVLDIDENTHRMTSVFVPFAKRRIHEIPVDVSDCISNVDIVKAIEDTVSFVADDYVKITLIGAMSVDRDDISPEYILSCFANKSYHVKVKDNTTLKVNMDDYLYEQSLKGEFVRLVNERDDLSEDEKAAVIRCGFEAISGGKMYS